MSSLLSAIILAMLVSCAGTDVFPKLGSALQKAKSGYVATQNALEKVAKVQALVCAPDMVVPAAVDRCAEADAALVEAGQYSNVARDVLNDAIDGYTKANNALTDASEADAGVP
jgi:hypothetical protein